MKRPFTTKDDPQTNFWSVADPEIQHAALKSKGMRTDRIGGDPESSAKKSRSGEFHRRHLIARSSKRRHQLVQMRPDAGFAFYIGDEALGRQDGTHPLVRNIDDVDLLLIATKRDMEQSARKVLQPDAQAGKAPRASKETTAHVG